MGILDKAKKLGNSALNASQKMSEGITNTIGDLSRDARASEHTMYELFVPGYGLGIKFAFTDNSILYGKEEYAYSDLEPIRVLNPATRVTNGTAQTHANGKLLTLAYEFGQRERFFNMLHYANEQIDQARGIKRDYEYVLYTSDASRLEVYSEYVMLYYFSSSAGDFVSNAMAGGATGIVIRYADMKELPTIAKNGEGRSCLKLQWNARGSISKLDLPLNDENEQLAREIVIYIQSVSQNVTENESKKADHLQEALDDWDQVIGNEHCFILGGKELRVSEERDVYNTHRRRYQKMAKTLATTAMNEYQTTIHDLVTFIEFYPEIYRKYLDCAVQKTVDVCVMEGLYTVTSETLMQQHYQSYHEGMDIYRKIQEMLGITEEENQKNASRTMAGTPSIIGGGFGAKGAAKGMLRASVINTAIGSVTKSVAKGQMQINPAQQSEIYKTIDLNDLFQRVFRDYFSLVTSLSRILLKNGRNIGTPRADASTQAQSIFKNLSNPNFPQEKKLDTMLFILDQDPYHTELYRYLISICGETAEVKALEEYFGFLV